MQSTNRLRFNRRRILVTGAAGFVGSHLVDALLEEGARVRALDNLATGRLENLADGLERIEFVRGDIRDLEVCRSACQGVDLVFHLAALGSVPRSLEDPATTISVNVSGTANVFAAARAAGVERVVYASSSSVYGNSDALPKKEGQEGVPLSPYALSKAIDEQLAAVFARNYGMVLIGLRYFNVYGPRQAPDGPYAAVVPRFFIACLSGKAPVIFGDGEQSRDFTFVSDAVEGSLLAGTAEAESGGRSYNVAGGRQTTILDLARAIREVVGSGLEPTCEPPRPGDSRHSLADLGDSHARLGYSPKCDLRSGLERTRAYYLGLMRQG